MKKLIVALLMMPSIVFAHPGHGFGLPFLEGLSHPVGGLDHVLAMVAVGLWAAVTGGRAIWAMPATFVVAMLVGGGLGWAGVPFPAVEPMITASIVLLGVAAALAWQPPLLVALVGIAVFGLSHGQAHGAEGPEVGLISYGAGFAIATMGLHLAGLIGGLALVRMEQATLARGIGGAVALGGLVLAAGWA